jgi:predicted XRE-type DNA-binding protein
MQKKWDDTAVFVGSSNVFADLGFPDAEELHTKAGLTVTILKILERRRLTQAQAAKILGVSQPKISALKNYKLDGFSVERLMVFLTALRHDVVIQISPQRRTAGRVMVQTMPKAVRLSATRVVAKRA